MRKALIVGIDHYADMRHLHGCVNDALAVKAVLERHGDGTRNFASPQVLLGTDAGPVEKWALRHAIEQLFHDAGCEIVLLYFAGHGYLTDVGGFLCASDSRSGDDGVPLSEVITWANASTATNKIIVLDSCYSGVAGNSTLAPGIATLAHGVTILTASTEDQSAYEAEGAGSGVFTNLFVDALNGAAANLVGDVTPGSVYAHIDQSLGPWAQRPVFKTNVRTFVSLRRTEAPIALADLHAVRHLFPDPDACLPLDPSFEPERSAEQLADPSIPPPDPANTRTFRTLQNCAKVNLIHPVGAPHMWHAAMQSRSCALTALGRHYWNLVAKELI